MGLTAPETLTHACATGGAFIRREVVVIRLSILILDLEVAGAVV